MALVRSLDANRTTARIAEEVSFKEVDSGAVWHPLEVNSYSDAKATFTKVVRNPIDADRQRKKGVTTDLDVSYGFQQDWTHYNTQPILEGLFYADYRRKTEFGGAGELVSVNGSNQITAASGLDDFPVGALCVLRNGSSSAGNSNRVLRVTVSTAAALTFAETLVAETLPAGAVLVQVGVRGTAGDLDISAAGAFPVMNSTTINFTTIGTTGLVPGEFLWIGGDAASTFYTNDENNALVRVRSVSANQLVFDKASKGAMTTEASTTETIEIYWGRVLKNESDPALIKRRSYQIERQFPSVDDSLPAEVQSEYFTGCIFNECVFNYAVADKLTLDMAFVGADQETRDGTVGIKDGTRPAVENADAQNTSSDVKIVRLSRVSSTEVLTPLFAFLPSVTITVNNGVEPLKALTNLGAFDMSSGDFTVTGQCEGYFTDVDAISAIRDNASLTMDIFQTRNNQGIAIDLPLVTLGDGSVQIEKDAAIMIPLTLECASGEEVASTLNYTLLICLFDGLPARASTPTVDED